jgi:hypothetical protein
MVGAATVCDRVPRAAEPVDPGEPLAVGIADDVQPGPPGTYGPSVPGLTHLTRNSHDRDLSSRPDKLTLVSVRPAQACRTSYAIRIGVSAALLNKFVSSIVDNGSSS